MTNLIQKPSFREKEGLIHLDDSGLTFNAQRVGPMNFAGLRNADYGYGFRMPTIPELIPLVYAALESQKHQTAKSIVNTLKDYWLTGNTGILYTPKGMFVQDNPSINDRRVVMEEKTLESKLGSHEEKGVVFSNDRKIRFVPYGFKTKSQTASELAENQGVIAFAGSQENAEKLAKSSTHYKQNPYFWALSNRKTPETRVAGLDSGVFVGRLGVDAGDGGLNGGRCSFGVISDAEGIAF